MTEERIRELQEIASGGIDFPAAPVRKKYKRKQRKPDRFDFAGKPLWRKEALKS
jgi:hypothetical protein